MLRHRAAIRKQERADHRRRDELSVMAVVPLKLVPGRRHLAIVLEIGERVVPVTGPSDLFAGEPSTVLEPTLANHRLQAGFAEVSAEGKIVLPRANENNVPLAISHENLHC